MTNLKETTLHSYSFSDGFTLLSSFEKVGEGKQLDWDGLEVFIKENEGNITSISAGMAEDWSATAGEVWNEENGMIEDSWAWTSSRWATPAIEVDYKDGTTKVYELYVEGM